MKPVTIQLSIAPSISEAILGTIALSPAPVGPVVVAVANERTNGTGGAAQTVKRWAEAKAEEISEVHIVTPPSLASLGWQRVRYRRGRSTVVDLRGREGFLSSARIATDLTTARTVIAVNDLRGESATRPVISIGIWGRFTDVRDRFGLTLSVADKGAAADIALAVTPAMIVLVDQWQDGFVAIAADDQIAAELAGLALKQLSNAEVDEPVGPWEDPLVQRATELHLGVLLPDQIALRGGVRQDGSDTDWSAISQLAEAIGLKLGVAAVSVGPAHSQE